MMRFSSKGTMQPDRTEELSALLERRILILDGAMGTTIQGSRLSEADFRGERFSGSARDLRGNNDLLTLTRPEVIREIPSKYPAAGADIIETNTFNSNAPSQADYGLERHVYELNHAAAKLAREAADEHMDRDPVEPRFVAGVLGPTNKTASISPEVNDPGFRNIYFDELVAAYGEALAGLADGGADLILLETIFDTLNAKAAVFAIEALFEERGRRLPVIVSGTITDQSGRTLTGQTPEAFWNSLRHARPIARGPELRARRETHASLHRGTVEGRRHLYQLLPQCRVAQSALGDRLRRNAGIHLGPAPRIRRKRLSEHRRRLLRHDARSYPRDRELGTGASTAQAAAHRKESAALGPGAAQHRRRIPLRQRRGAHQRLRLPRLCAHDPRRRLSGRPRRGASAGRQRRPGDRREHGRGDARLAQGDDHFPAPHRLGARHLARAGDDRFLEVVGDRGGPQVRAGQVRGQLDFPQGRRGGI